MAEERKAEVIAKEESKTIMEVDILVVGAGLVGSLAALCFVKEFPELNVAVIETRKDWRKASAASSSYVRRSINMALSRRGQDGLRRVGLLDQVVNTLGIPMKCRAIHPWNSDLQVESKEVQEQRYDEIDPRNYNLSVGREDLNHILLDHLKEKITDKNILFEHKLIDIKQLPDDSMNVIIENIGCIRVRKLVLGCDGAFSPTRNLISHFIPTEFHREYISHGYKELSMPPNKDTGDYALAPVQALHIWPRDEFMLIALPNPDKSFTCTLFAPFHATDENLTGLLDINSDSQILDYFKKYFPAIPDLIPDLVEQFKKNPASRLVQVSTSPWNYKDKILVIGDAAHAIVPFYGQGMNAGFEDVIELLDTIKSKEFNGNFEKAIPHFAKVRKPRADAIRDLSRQNYVEMRHKTNSKLFLFQKYVEGWLNYFFPSVWIPLYKMVAFTRIPYDEVIRRAKVQDFVLKASFGVASLLIINLGYCQYNQYIRN